MEQLAADNPDFVTLTNMGTSVSLMSWIHIFKRNVIFFTEVMKEEKSC